MISDFPVSVFEVWLWLVNLTYFSLQLQATMLMWKNLVMEVLITELDHVHHNMCTLYSVHMGETAPSIDGNPSDQFWILTALPSFENFGGKTTNPVKIESVWPFRLLVLVRSKPFTFMTEYITWLVLITLTYNCVPL